MTRAVSRFAIWFVALVLALAAAVPAQAGGEGCHEIPVTYWSPTGTAGCVIYGSGTASRWDGPGVARPDCEYPWADCQTIRITSHLTGVTITVRPTMFCGCYQGLGPGETGPGGERPRIVDLDPGAVAALGLDWNAGLFAVTVEPVDAASGLPDTAMEG